MDRETAINVVIGSFLILVLAAICVACAEGLGLALYATYAALKHFVPTASDAWNIEFFGLISLVILIGCARQIRKRLWTNAFLSFTAGIAVVLPWILKATPHHGIGDAHLRFPLSWFIAFLLPQTIRASRSEFIACASIICTAFSVNVGLLGSGALSTFIGIVLYLAIMGWMLVKARDGGYGNPWSVFSPSNS